MENNKYIFWGLTVMACAVLLGAFVASITFYKIRSFDNTLSVTGSAKQKVVADSVKWTSAFSRTIYADGIKEGYKQMAGDEAAVLKFLKEKNIPESSITTSTVTMSEVWKNYEDGRPKQYILTENVQVQSSDVQGITAVAKNTAQIADMNIMFSTQSLEYFYGKLPETRVNLLSDAIKDAKNRADKLASSTGKKVGPMKSASMGVVQIMPENSTETADYGMYDTSTINKEIMVVVKAQFVLD